MQGQEQSTTNRLPEIIGRHFHSSTDHGTLETFRRNKDYGSEAGVGQLV